MSRKFLAVLSLGLVMLWVGVAQTQTELDALLRDLEAQADRSQKGASCGVGENDRDIGTCVEDPASNVVGFVFSPVRFQSRIGRYEDGPKLTYNVPRFVCERSGKFVVLVKIDRRSGKAEMVAVPNTNSVPNSNDSFFYFDWLYKVDGRNVMDMRDVPCISCFE